MRVPISGGSENRPRPFSLLLFGSGMIARQIECQPAAEMSLGDVAGHREDDRTVGGSVSAAAGNAVSKINRNVSSLIGGSEILMEGQFTEVCDPPQSMS